ncbi:pyridoxamine 5'-phosphate oxidase family protein [Rhizobium sp. P40RR-XXII]|uniref:pyridoxamine 5'-phosphate oxidase family protein n=1 Tax=Rhizobium sp. P40RR-XXII TaxID=2726739 RepID=UPI001456A56A|nr:pyridoxamine 5'-phosphate oxidase family protein [Rhizobium sp. P40RR-XXII]NLS20436.1 pyridoxamine 5'-phosphate oxidase family protein [Rhizobium sp. P40RR-XXII]
MSATFASIDKEDCLKLLDEIAFGNIVVRNDGPSNILPAFFVREGSKIFGLMLVASGDMQGAMDPDRWRLVANEIKGDQWYLVVISGPSQQFPVTEAFKGERAHAWRLLQERNPCWKGKKLDDVFSVSKKEVAVCFSMWLDEISGYRIESQLFQRLPDP